MIYRKNVLSIVVAVLGLLLFTSQAMAQVNFEDGFNPFLTFVCPIINQVRSFGIPVLIIVVVVIGVMFLFLKDGSDSKGSMEILKNIMGTFVMIGIIMILYFAFEEQIFQWFPGSNVCINLS